MFIINNFFSSVSFQKNISSNIAGKSHLHFLGKNENNDNFIPSVSAKKDFAEMHLDEQEQYIKKKFQELREIELLKAKSELLQELCKIESPLVNKELNKLLSEMDNETSSFKFYVLDAAMAKKYPDLKGKFIVLTLNKDINKRKQVINELADDKREGINKGLVKILDFTKGNPPLGINILDCFAQRLDPRYKGYCLRLADMYETPENKEKILEQLLSDKRSQSETILINLFKLLKYGQGTRKFLPPKYKFVDSLRIEIMQRLANKEIIDNDPERLIKRKNRIRNAILSEFKNTNNQVKLRLEAFETLIQMHDPDKYIYESIKTYVQELEHNLNEKYSRREATQLIINTAKKCLEI